MIDSDRLEAFVVFGESRNLTRAADALHLSQPSLHAKLRKLAEEVGAPLYRRVGRQLVLTSTGKRLLQHGREQRDRDARFVAGLRGSPQRPIVLAAGAGSLRYLLGEGIAEYLTDPPAPLQLRTLDAGAALAAVEDGCAHAAVGVFSSVPPDLSATVLAEVGSVLLVPEEHRLRSSASLDDLADTSLIVPPPGAPQRVHLEVALSSRVDWTAAVEARGWDLALHLASLGLGLAVVNDFCPAPPGLRAVALPELGTVVYRLVCRRDPAPALQHLRRSLMGAGKSR